MNALTANIIIIILELIGLYMSLKRIQWRTFALYTQLSNIVTLISSVCFVISRDSALTIDLRYLSTVMLIMTVLIALSVLIPMGFSFSRMMLRGMGLIHHTLCPIISVSSYFLWEKHSSVWYLPVAVTFLYGLVMLCLNYKEVVDGPYPFLRIRNQSKAATFAWMTGLLLLITLLSLAVTALAK